MFAGIAEFWLGNKHVDRGNNKEGEKGSNDHSGNKDNTDAIARSCTGACGENQGGMTDDGGNGGHQDRPEPGAGCCENCIPFVHS